MGEPRVTYPSNRLANVKDLKVDDPVDITYPDGDSPGVLLKLGTRVDGGAGPDGDIVAYSTPLSAQRLSARLQCRRQDAELPRPLFALRLREGRPADLRHVETRACPCSRSGFDDKGDIYAEGADELIYGRTANVL